MRKKSSSGLISKGMKEQFGDLYTMYLPIMYNNGKNLINTYVYIYIYIRELNLNIQSNTDFKIYEQVFLDYLREGFPWLARPIKHTESKSFNHTVTLHLNIRTDISYSLLGLGVWPALHIFQCRYRIYIYINVRVLV